MKAKKPRRLTALLLALTMLLSMTAFGNLSAAAQSAENEEDWGDAHWIWSSAPEDTSTEGTFGSKAPVTGLATTGNVWMNFRRDFTLAEVPAQAQVQIAADSKYWMWINGEEVVWEGSVIRGPRGSVSAESDLADTYYDELDISQYLKEGKNTIAVQVWYWGQSGNGANQSPSGGLLFHSDLIDADNEGRAVESGDGKWMAKKDLAYQTAGGSNRSGTPSVRYDAQAALGDWISPSYNRFLSDNWNVAKNIGYGTEDPGRAGCGPWNALWRRPIPFWKDYGLTISSLEPVTGAEQTFEMKTLADAGRVGAEPYSISSDFKMEGTRETNGNVHDGIYYVFAATSAAETDFYQAFLDFSSFLNGTNSPKMTVTKGSEPNAPILEVDLSGIITADNYKSTHNFKIDVVSSDKIDYILDDKLIGTTTAIDATMENATFGFKISGGTNNAMLLPITKAEVTNLCVKAGDRVLCDSEDLKKINTTIANASSRGYTMKDGVYYPSVASKEYPAYLYGENTYTENRYRITLPHTGQIVPYIKFGANTQAGEMIQMWTNTHYFGGQRSEYVTKAGEQEYEAKGWINGDQLFFKVPFGVEIIEAGYRETGYAVTTGTEVGQDTDFVGYFDSVVDSDDASVSQFTGGHTWAEEQTGTDNNFYDELWKKSVRTVYETIRDQYMDCAAQERAQYIGDAVNEMEEAYYSLGPELNAIGKKAIYNIVDHQFSKPGTDGRETDYFMSNVRPGRQTQEIIMQSLATAHAVYNHYLFTGDQELPEYTYQRLYNTLTMHDMETEGDYAGLVKIRTKTMGGWGSGWLDWGNNQDTLLTHNVWWYTSAKAVRQLADAEGSGATQTQKDWLDSRMKSIEDNFYKFWNEDLQAYAVPWSKSTWTNATALANGSHIVDDRMNALGVICGLIPEEKYPAMRDVFMGTETAPAYENASIYMEKYVIEALYKMGYAEDAMERISKRHMDMVNEKEISAMPEHWDYRTNGSVGHGWSGGSMIAMSRYAAGVEPTEAGYAAWHIVPQMGNFLSIETRVPSEIGNIDVLLNRDKETGTVEMTVTSPGGNAEFWVPLQEGQSVVQTTGNTASYLGVKQAYQKSYAVFASNQAGSFSFTASDKQGCANKQILQKVLSYAEEQYAADEFAEVIELVQASFTAALENARSVNTDFDATQQEVDGAWQTLMTEIHKLGFVRGDKTSLGKLIETADEFLANIDRYTPATSEPFVEVLSAAKEIYNDGNAMQDDVSKAEDNLLQAMLVLRFKADKSVLESVLKEADLIDTTQFTAETVEAFLVASKEAVAVNSDLDATQQQVDAAAEDLKAAMNNLQAAADVSENLTQVQGDQVLTAGGGNAKTGETGTIAVVVASITLAGAGLMLSKKRK